MSTEMTGKHAEEQARKGAHDASKAAGHFQEAAADAVGHVKESLSNLGTGAKDYAAQQYEQLRDTATDYISQGRDKVSEVEESLEKQIRNEPLKAVLIAAGIGFLVGTCFMRR